MKYVCMEIMLYRRWTFTAVTVKTETVCKTLCRPTTAVADATVIVVTADAVDASCDDSHDNATETNDYDSNEETTAEPILTHSNKYRWYYYANYKYNAAIIKYVMHIIITALLYEQISCWKLIAWFRTIISVQIEL